MKIRFAPQAIEDLEAAVAFLAERSPSAAARLADRVFAIIDTLAEGQFEGPESVLASGERVRSWPVAPLRVYYQRTPDALWILRVYHQARRPLTG